jgi:perosamine synthetase
MYTERLSGMSQVKILHPKTEVTSFIPFKVIMISDFPIEGLLDHMNNNEVQTRTLFYPLHKQPCFSKFMNDERYSSDSFINSTFAYTNGACLPTHVGLTEDQIDFVCGVVESYLK